MRTYNVVLSLALGVLITIGLVVALDSVTAPVKAQTLSITTSPAIEHADTVGDAVGAALAYLHTQQQPDGGIDAFGMGASNEGGTILSLLSLAVSGRPANSMVYSGTGKTMVDYLAEHAISYTHQTTYTTSDYMFPQQAGYLLIAVAAADQDPTSFGGMDLVTQLEGTYQPATGAYSTTAQEGFYTGAAEDDNQALVILGLVAAGRSVPVTATGYLLNTQAASGSWGTDDDPDTTAMVVVALVASGHVQPTDAAIQKALDYLRNVQLPSGGWRPSWDVDPANANSTGWVIQALAAVGYTPATESWAASPNPHQALLALQMPNGCIGGTYANAFSTAGALLGLTERPVFALGQTLRALRALTWMNELQTADGSWPSAFGQPAGPACDAVLAYAAAGFDPDTVKAPGSVTSAMDYLAVAAASFVTESAASAGKLALAIEAAGEDAHNFGGLDIVHVLTGTWYSPTVGAFGDANNSWDQAFAVLGLAAAGETVPVSAPQTLLGLQNPDGSWVDAWGFDKPGSTGLALQALIAAGVPVGDASIVSGVSALLGEQNDQGSWDAFGSPSVNSTAYAMQGLLAAGEDLTAAKWLKNSHSPYNALADLQRIDGPFTFWSADDFFSTRQAVPAQLGVHYPFTHALTPFVGVDRGPDPDRMVAASPRATWGDSVDVIIPFGSDLDGDGSVTLGWRVSGATSWVTSATVHRADGYYTATLAATQPVAYEFQATFADPDSVQYADGITDTVVLTITLEPYRVHLPLVLKQ
jgi:hypothetical protein